ncbi:hypothetical protein FRC01_012399 [Tulasnella sp. 417]|nr:hypothetical protein FRC01_012399 [Tulasnella sp. 417]
MADKPFVLDSSGIRTSDPRHLSIYLAAQYRVLESKTNRDLVAEFCHLVVLLDLEHGNPPQDLLALVHGVMKNPEPGELEAAIEELKDYADRLPSTALPITQKASFAQKDPRKRSNAIADAWKQSKKIREGRAGAKLDEKLVSDSSSSNQISKGQIPIRVQVWSQTEGKMYKPASEIRCAVPRLSTVANLDNIVRYAASAGFNFPYSSDGKPRSRPENVTLSSKAMLYSASSDIDWVLRDKSTRLGDVVDNAHRLHIVNTKLKTLAVAVAVRYPQQLSEHFIFDISEPLKLVSALRDCTTETQVRLNINRATDSFIQTRFLTIFPEERALPPSSSRDLRTDPPARLSNANPSLGALALNSPALDSPRATPPVLLSQLEPLRAQAHPPGTVGPQASVDRRVADLRSPSPASSHYSDAGEDFEKASSQVTRDRGSRQSVRIPPSTNQMPMVSAASSSSMVLVDTSASQNATLSTPEKQADVDTAAPVHKQAPDLFAKRVVKRFWG